jgi:uncharacterized phage protein (TIGR01671 family)
MNNQREIKLRAWVDNANRMFGPFTLKELSDGRISVDEPDGRGYIFLDESDLMQYTGLKDKGGKEIYEGDILSCKTNSHREAENMEVYYDQYDGAYGLRDPTRKIGGNLLFFHIGTPEVIGNIYENPELLANRR